MYFKSLYLKDDFLLIRRPTLLINKKKLSLGKRLTIWIVTFFEIDI